MITKLNVLICYAQQDRAFAETLMNHLVSLEQQNLLTFLEDSKLETLNDPLSYLRQELTRSHTVLLLVSRYFLDSPWLNQPEFAPLWREAQRQQCRVVPVILSACNWSALDFCKDQALPKGFVPLERALYPSRAWAVIARKIEEWCHLANSDLPLESERLQMRLSALPVSQTPLVGRQHYLSALDKAFNGADTDVVGIYAGSGVGKTALINAWLKRMAPYYGGAQRVFGWSFYNQEGGYRQSSSLIFFEQALPFFGHQGPLPKTEESRARRLIELMQDRPSLLILDGLEPLQRRPYSRYGELLDMGIKTLLQEIQKKRLGKQRLLILSSRQTLPELNGSKNYRKIELENLSTGESASLLKILGVKGSPWQLIPIARAYSGHALALLLFGNLCVDAYAGEAHTHLELPVFSAQEDDGAYALQIIRFYDQQHWPQHAPERLFLQLLSLLDRPMTGMEKNVLLAEAELAWSLRGLTELDWYQVHHHLGKLGLFSERRSGAQVHYDTHSLVRHYFSQQLQANQATLWQQAHFVLFEYFQRLPRDVQPDSLLALEPLYRAVHHACLAGEFRQGLNLYRDRILRGDDYYSTRQLGSYSLDLSLIADFFEDNWQQPTQSDLSIEDQSWLLAQASFYLLSLGRLQEALLPQKMALQIREEMQDWKNATNLILNHVDLLLSLGQLEDALKQIQQGLIWAERSGHLFIQMQSYAKYGRVLFLLGRLEESRQAFITAEEIQTKDQPEHPQLYSLSGTAYATLLLELAKDETQRLTLLKRVDNALDLSQAELGLMSVAFDHLMRGRIYAQLQRWQDSQRELDTAVAGMRKANLVIFTPECLLTRAELCRQQGNLDQARQDLEEAQLLIQRCGMRRDEAEACLIEGHLLLDERCEQINRINSHTAPRLHVSYGDYSFFRAEQVYMQAARLIRELPYPLKQAELSLLAARLAYYTQYPEDAYSHLDVAKEHIFKHQQWRLLPRWEQVREEVA
jgi:hypothetical protein